MPLPCRWADLVDDDDEMFWLSCSRWLPQQRSELSPRTKPTSPLKLALSDHLDLDDTACSSTVPPSRCDSSGASGVQDYWNELSVRVKRPIRLVERIGFDQKIYDAFLNAYGQYPEDAVIRDVQGKSIHSHEPDFAALLAEDAHVNAFPIILTMRLRKAVSAHDWSPNVHAPEFLPVMSAQSFVYYVPTQVSNDVREATASTTYSAGKDSGRARKTRQRRRPAALAVPERVSKMHPAAVQVRGPPHKVMPEATEEEWLHRAKIRAQAITIGKNTDAYKAYMALKPRDMREDGEPMTPDHLDRSVSKRTWKHQIQMWRKQLAEIAGECEEETGSCDCQYDLDECQSVITATTDTGGAATLPDDVADIDNDCDSSQGSYSP